MVEEFPKSENIMTTRKKKSKKFNPKLKEECGVFGISNNNDTVITLK